LPQKYLVEQICGDKFTIKVLLPPGANHETFEPTPRDMANLEGTKLFFTVGYLDFELNWIPRFASSYPGLEIVNTSTGIPLIAEHPGLGERHRSGVDPHTWLCPANAKIQTQTIANTIIAADPINATYYRSNLERFKHLADSVDTQIRVKLASCQGRAILIFHPALAYFAREYGLEQVSIEYEGKEPSAARIRELIDIARKKNIKAILVSREFDTRNAEAIAAEIHARVIVFDPMAADWPGNLVHLAGLIAENQ